MSSESDSAKLTFKMKKDVRAIVFEHLCCKLNIHVLNVDLLFIRQLVCNEVAALTSRRLYELTNLQVLIHDHDCFIEFLLPWHMRMIIEHIDEQATYNIGNDAREKKALLMLMRAFLKLIIEGQTGLRRETNHDHSGHEAVRL